MRFIRDLYLLTCLVLFTLSCQPSLPAAEAVTALPVYSGRVVGSRSYSVQLTLRIKNNGPGIPDKQNLWVALLRDFSPYQEVLSQKITPLSYRLVTDELGNQYAEFDFSGQPVGVEEVIHIEHVVRVNELTYDLAHCSGALPDEFNQPELHIESANPQIVARSKELSQGKGSVCQQIRSFYDYVAGELVYSFNGRNWGAQAALGPMGADCTEYASLLVALSRAQGIPARYFEGLLFREKDLTSLARVEHAWADVFLPGAGWVSLDPTLGRSSIYRETYFAHHTPDHIILTMGASPSTLRGSSYWTHLYWPGDSTRISVQAEDWVIEPVN